MVWYAIGPGAVTIFSSAHPVLITATAITVITAAIMTSVIPKHYDYGYYCLSNGCKHYEGKDKQAFRRFDKGSKIVAFHEGENNCYAYGIPKRVCSELDPIMWPAGIIEKGQSGYRMLSPKVKIGCKDDRKTIVSKVKKAVTSLEGYETKTLSSCKSGKTVKDVMEHVWN